MLNLSTDVNDHREGGAAEQVCAKHALMKLARQAYSVQA